MNFNNCFRPKKNMQRWITLGTILFSSSMLLSIAGCAQTVEWTEDVRLLGGRVITVSQKRLCAGGDYTAKTGASCLARDSWVRMNLPEYSANEIVWHETLNPMVIDVFKGALYIVGRPPTKVEFRKYGAVNPPYYGFRWVKTYWQPIPFSEIPLAIYDGNMLIESIPKTRSSHVGLDQKKIEVSGYQSMQMRIDPNSKSTPH